MAAIMISSLVTFFFDEPKSIKRGKNHFKLDHILSFSYCPGIINGKIQASMKDKAYKATVSTRVSYSVLGRSHSGLVKFNVNVQAWLSNVKFFFDDS